MTLKQERFLTLLPKHNYNEAKTMKEAGYTKSTCRSGEQYRILRKLTQRIDHFSPDEIRKDIQSVFRLAKKKEDITNLNRNCELKAKISGLIKPDIAVQTNIIFSEEEGEELAQLRAKVRNDIQPVVSNLHNLDQNANNSNTKEL